MRGICVSWKKTGGSANLFPKFKFDISDFDNLVKQNSCLKYERSGTSGCKGIEVLNNEKR